MKLLTALALTGLSLVPGPQETAGQVATAVSPSGPVSTVLREEFFVLEVLPADLDPTVATDLERTHSGALSVGLAACRRRNDADGRMLEWDLRFHEEDVRVLHVERETASGPSLVWREWQANRGRTLIVEPRANATGGGARILEWGGEWPVRRELASGTLLPLALLERLRSGEIEAGTFQVFDPLARRTEELRVHLRASAPRARLAVTTPGATGALLGDTPARRIVELLRRDGSVAGTYVFEGADLAAFQWQAGHLRARRIDALDYLQRMAAAGH